MVSGRTYLTCALFALSLLLCLPSYGQVAGATLNGTVADSTGAVVTGVKISIRSLATGITRESTTDAAGFYTVPNLVPGVYEISASAPGFATVIRPNVVLTVGEQQVLNLSLQVGAVAQQVEVTAGAPTVELSSSTLSNEVDEATIRELPLNGRDWTQLATLQPGVASLGSQQLSIGGSTKASSRGIRGFGTPLTISGIRPQQNNYRMDGISLVDYSASVPGNALGVSLGVDAIQEFSVLTSNYSSEYGRTAGGVINAITRSGTNQFHGDVYEFLRNSALDARNYFDGVRIPAFRRNQFGAAGGAPIRKDKSFIFVDYEGLRQSLGITGRPIVPSADARNGIIHNLNGTTTTIKVDPQVTPFLAIYALPNAGLIAPGNTGIYSFVGQQLATENFVTARFDHRFSDKDSFFGTYNRDRAVISQPDGLNTVLSQQTTASQHVALEESHLFSTRLINTVRFGYNRVHDIGGGGLSAINPAAADLALAAISGQDAPAVSVTGLQPFNSGLNDQAQVVEGWNSFQGYDDANLTLGKHSLKFGGNVERDQDNSVKSSFAGGSFSFGSLNALLLNQPTSFKAFVSGPKLAHYRLTILGAYVQDDIHWRPNITINLGVRYEMSTVPTEADNKLATLLNATDPTPHLGSPWFNNSTFRNFAPRVGFAWDPFGNGKTSVRAGFGIFDVLPLLYEFTPNAPSAAPFSVSAQNSKLPSGTFPLGALATAKANPLQNANYIEQNPKRNYVMQWNLSFQRELATGLTVTAAYVGSHSVHDLFTPGDINLVVPTLTSAAYLWPSPIGSGTVLNPHVATIIEWAWNENAFYDGLQAQVEKRLSHGLEFHGSYTWGKSIDGGSNSGIDYYTNTVSNLFFFQPRFNRSLSDFNVKNILVASATWTAPKPNWGNRAADWTLGGWELGEILQARTGLPFSAVIGGDPLGTLSSSPEDFPNRVGGPGCASAVNPGSINYINLSCFALPTPTSTITAQCVAFKTVKGTCQNLQGNAKRNSLIGPGVLDLDLSLIKNNYIGPSEKLKVQFRAEFFNILNRTNFNPPTDNTSVFGADGSSTAGTGLIDGTSTTSRQIQFGLKLIW